MKLVSIIIPVYNTEKWLSRCINSIISQTYKEIEIIIVNDGSSDKSEEIIKTYAEKDKRIVFINQENHGVSYSRNIGISISKGEYVAFVDSDDYIVEDYIEKLTHCMTKGVDLVICGYDEVFIHENTLLTSSTHILDKSKTLLLTGNIYTDLYYVREYVNSPCLKLYRKKHIIEHNIRFPDDMITGEDYIFNLNFYQYVSKYIFLPYAGYHYFNNAMSITHSVSLEHFKSILLSKERSRELLDGHIILNRKKYDGEQICSNLKWFVSMKDNGSLFGYLKLMRQLEKKRTFAVLESKKSTVILLFYKMHLLGIYYIIAKIRRNRMKV